MPVHSSVARAGLRFGVSLAATLLGASSFATPICHAQMQRIAFAASTSSQPDSADAGDAPIAGEASTITQQSSAGHDLLHSIGTELHVGINGAGVDVALPVARRWNVRVGGQYLQYTGHFTEQGANIDATLKVGNGKAGLDWFPFGNGFHVSPQVYFAIQTDMQGTVIVPAGQTISLNGAEYVSSNADPLTGTAHIATRKAAPGLAIGWGNISPRGSRHLSFPVEIGFYYIGQPSLAVTFKGSACSPALPQPAGCQSVTADTGFQNNLARFIARNNHNLSYASFFPVAQFGVGYRF